MTASAMHTFAYILRKIARNLGSEYGGCVHLSVDNIWGFQFADTDQATAWRVGKAEHQPPTWIILTHGSDPEVRLSRSADASVRRDWEAIQRFGTDLPPEGVTNEHVKAVRRKLLHFLEASGNTRLRWTKDFAELPSDLTETSITVEYGALPPRQPPRQLPPLRKRRNPTEAGPPARVVRIEPPARVVRIDHSRS